MNKKNLPVIFAFAIPVLMVIGIALSIYLPRMFASPEYDFMYIVGSDVGHYGYSGHDGEYSVDDGFVVRNKAVKDPYYNYEPKNDEKFYIYAVEEGEAEEITFTEARDYELDSNSESPDGYGVDCSRKVQGMFLFFVDTSRDCSKRVISKDGGGSDDLNIRGLDYNNFKFLGWITD